MKKKIVCLLMAMVLTLSMSTAAFATQIDQDSSPATGSTEITTSITPAYIVTIPADTTIPFEATSTDLGNVELTSAQLEVNKAVQVTASAGALANDEDSTKTIPYTLNSADGEFASARYTADGDYTALTVDIAQNDWDNAYAGSYSGTITFTVSYVDAN